MIVARVEEQKLLKDLLLKDASQFVAIYGRRRIGKTYLINEVYKDKIIFSHSGVYKGTYKEQIETFTDKLEYYGLKDYKKPKSWFDAFFLLLKLIDNSKKEKKVIFLDELSWMASTNHNFIKALENFWNSYLSSRNDIVLVVCASATSWIINNVIHNKGGLHNRVTCTINLKPFTLKEVEDYLNSNKVNFNRKQILQLYMILGGIPYYLSLLKSDFSFASNIDKLFAGESATLKDEHEYLYKALFDNPDTYIKIVKALAKGTKAGLSRTELLKASNQIDNGNFTLKLQELEQCGIIRIYNPFGKNKKNYLIQLIDNFTLFYYQFLDTKQVDDNFFSSIINTPLWTSWSGIAFERVCLEHIKQIKNALQIGGVKTEICSFYANKDEEKGIKGSQIDLLIIRKDETINLCEMKFSSNSYLVSSKDIEKMEIKINDLINVTKTKFAIIPTLIVFPDVNLNSYSNEFNSIINADMLFS